MTGGWETLRALRGRARWEYVWDYYKLPLLGILLLLFLLGYGAYRLATDRESVLYVALVNVSVGQEGEEALTGGFLRDQGLDGRKYQVTLSQGLILSDSDQVDPQYAYASEMKLLASINAKRLDVVILDESARDVFLRDGCIDEAVDLSGAPAFQGFRDPVYLGILKNSPHPARAEAYLNYLLS